MDELCKVCEGLCCGEIPRLNAELQRLRSLDLDYVAKVLTQSSERAADIIFDADSLNEQSKDPGLDGMIAGIKAVAQQLVTSLDALTALVTTANSAGDR
jgi:hypothetical protein